MASESSIERSPLKWGDTTEEEGCICFKSSDMNTMLANMLEIEKEIPNFSNIDCIIDNISRTYNLIFGQNPKVVDSYKIAFTDIFFRIRHEILFKCLCLSLNEPAEHSDRPFRNFSIDSDRTPDLIVKKGDFLIIIEVTATSGFEKAALMKGMEQMGFESKYQNEINMFIDKGIPCRYCPVFFDMSNSQDPINVEQLNDLEQFFKPNKGFKHLLRKAAKSFLGLTLLLKNNIKTSATILFSKEQNIEFDHKMHEFLYERIKSPIKQDKYKQLTISTSVYNKVNKNLNRMLKIAENSTFKESDRLSFIINTSNNNIGLEKTTDGEISKNLISYINNLDKISIFKNTKIRAGGVLMNCVDSETGIKIFEKYKNEEMSIFDRTIPLVVDHSPQLCPDKKFSMEAYEKKSSNYTKLNLRSIHYDDGYEDTILKAIEKSDSLNICDNVIYKKDLLGNMLTSNIDMSDKINSLIEGYLKINKNSDEIPITRLKMKSPFILPIADVSSLSYCKLDYKNELYIKSIVSEISPKNPYTSLILENVLKDSYSMYKKSNPASQSLNKLLVERSSISNSLNKLQKSLIRSKPVDGVIKLSKSMNLEYKNPFEKLRLDFKAINKKIQQKCKLENIKQDISFIRLPTRNKNRNSLNDLGKLFKIEVSHFKNEIMQSNTEGVGIRDTLENDYTADKNTYFNICEFLCTYKGINRDIMYDENITEDAQLLKDLKTKSLKDYSDLKNEIQDSALGHSSSLISNLAHSLMFYSQLPFNSDYIRVDNLGYSDVLLIVKGGKKIFKSKASKMFRLIVPIPECVVSWYKHGHLNEGSSTLLKYKEKWVLLTPWSMLHESILTDSISFYSRVTSFTLLNLNPNLELKSQFDKISMNILLAFHNKRQSETLLANLRYILLSTMGDFTGSDQILKEFLGFNYDCFQSFIRASIIFNYPAYFDCLENLKNKKKEGKLINEADYSKSGLKNIFTGNDLNDVENMAIMIYSTFLMTKAPYQRVAERARNLRGILEIHELYDNNIGLDKDPEKQLKTLEVECNGDLEKYCDDLFKSDFNFDPKYCASAGNFIDSLLYEQGDADNMHNEWIKIMNQTWDELATSTGLRGDYEKIEDFWGKKGYFVVYKNILANPCYSDNIMKVFSLSLSDDEKRKILRSLNEIYSNKLSPDREFLIFHAVDKVQWRGGREIYVMDLMTKTLQQPIEKYMAFLCSKLDNELISIPSDKRAQIIHHTIFEKDLPLSDVMTWYLTLDCSKWAPKSIFVKFAITFLSMQNLPPTFKVHFLNYIEKLYKKRIYFNVAEVEALEKNERYSHVCKKYLIKDDTVNGYYLEMPYSWVMGIFNYTSSFLHATNQKYFSYLLTKSSLLNLKEDTAMVMFAHSDDSGGRLTVSNLEMARRSLVLYEINLKSCNHILSKKKSVVSRIYFEILSVIYVFNKLLALLPKFLGGIRFLPTDKGPCQDISQSYSKCIEVLVAGATFDVAYIVMKITSCLIWKFYMKKMPKPEDYQRPVQYLGMPDAHPLFVLLCGSDSDILRLIQSDRKKLALYMSFVDKSISTLNEQGPIKPFKFMIKVKGLEKGFEVFLQRFEEIFDKWSIGNVNYHNTAMNTLSFLKKLRDPGFIGSLVNESTVRRISRSYHISIGDSCMTSQGNVKLKLILDSLRLLNKCPDDLTGLSEILECSLSPEVSKNIIFDIKSSLKDSDKRLSLIDRTMESPINIYNYLNQLSLENRKISISKRTLKPTQVQLIKTSKVFSVDFDPASLVSYIKEPELRWALKDVKNLFTAEQEVISFCEKMDFPINEITEDNLLRICRTYGKDNIKNIYLYSRVPSDIRNIKTYSAFLTFLSVNSFPNKEIGGLTLKLSNKDASREYLSCNVDNMAYYAIAVINLISVIIKKCGVNFTKGLSLKPVKDLVWEGGNVENFLKHITDNNSFSLHKCLLELPIFCLKKILKINTGKISDLNMPAYYIFVKSQKVKGGWYGKGEVLIKIENSFYSFQIDGIRIMRVYTNRLGRVPQHHSEFIMDVLHNINLSFKSIFSNRSKGSINEMFLGNDQSGCLAISGSREIYYGIKAEVIENRPSFLDNIKNYDFKSMNENSVTIVDRISREPTYKKIYCLPLRKTDLIPIIKLVINPSDFESKIMEEGLNDFEDFLMTEILTEYGRDNYIDFEDFIDNFAGSKIYEILNESYKKEYSYITQTLKSSIIPASQGSLTRIFIDYSATTDDKIIKTSNNIDPEMMKIRSEYPEEMSVLLSNKLVECHNKIYNNIEQMEIIEAYTSLQSNVDGSELRKDIIKLMTFWGYGSLVNVLQTFRLNKSPDNYTFFNLSLNDESHKAYYSQVFEYLIKSINSRIAAWENAWPSVETPIKRLKDFSDIKMIPTNFVLTTVLSSYCHLTTDIRFDLYHSQYINCILGFFTIDEFIAEIQSDLNKNYVLSSLIVNYKERRNFIIMLNTLKDVWLRNNKCNYDLDYTKRLERLPDNIPNYRSLMRSFDINLSPSETYFHSAINNETLSHILSKSILACGTTLFETTSSISKLSKTKIPLNKNFKFKLPLKPEILDEDDWDELTGEIIIPDFDEDYVEELWGNLSEPYVESKVKKFFRKSGKVVTGEMKWVLMPYSASRIAQVNLVRQVGENIFAMSNVFMPSFLSCLPNSGCRLVNYSKHFKKKMRSYFIHYTVNEEFFRRDFIDQYIGGVEINEVDEYSEILGSDNVRNIDGKICKTSKAGLFINDEIMSGEVKIVNEDSKTVLTRNEVPIEESKYTRILKMIDSYEGTVSEQALSAMKKKYLEQSFKRGLSLKIIVGSFLNEVEMTKILEGIINNTLNLSTEQQIKSLLSPTYFGLSYGVSRTENGAIRDKRVRSELKSLHETMPNGIGSGTIKISREFSKVVKANHKLWHILVKNSIFKKEQKNFLLTLFTGCCNSAREGEDNSNDYIWQEIINKITVYMSSTSPEEEDDFSFLNSLFSIKPASRLKYRPEGM